MNYIKKIHIFAFEMNILHSPEERNTPQYNWLPIKIHYLWVGTWYKLWWLATWYGYFLHIFPLKHAINCGDYLCTNCYFLDISLLKQKTKQNRESCSKLIFAGTEHFLMKSTTVDESLTTMEQMFCSRENQLTTRLIQQNEKSTQNKKVTFAACQNLNLNMFSLPFSLSQVHHDNRKLNN